MSKKVYPSWRYHKELEPKIIHSEEQEAEGWLESPAHHEMPQAKEVEQAEEAPKKSKKQKPESEKEA